MKIAIDFDGTVVDHRYPEIGTLVPGARKYIRELKSAGATLLLWTMRSGETLDEAIEFLEREVCTFHGYNKYPQTWTNSPKLYAHCYVDDAAFGCPLKENPRMGGRPYVDWYQVGPALVERVLSE